MEKIFESSKKQNICEKALSDVYVHKISSRYRLENCPSFGVLKVETAIFMLFLAISAFFRFSKFVRFGPFRKCFRAIFSGS